MEDFGCRYNLFQIKKLTSVEMYKNSHCEFVQDYELMERFMRIKRTVKGMRYFCLLFILFGFLLFPFYFAHGLVIPLTTEEALDEFEIIVLGTVTDVKQMQDKTPVYTIEIEENVKNQEYFGESKTIYANGCTPNSGHIGIPCPSYSTGNRGLFLLDQFENDYQVSFYSQTAEPHCTSEQFLANYRGMQSGMSLMQDGQSETFFTGKEIEIHHSINNNDMKEKEYSVILSAYSKDFDYSDVIKGTIRECSGFETISTSFVPTKMGIYGFSVDSDSGEENFVGLSIIEPLSSPLKQFKAHIHAQDTWCKDGYILVLKKDKTKNMIFDNKPSCVKPDTVSKLVQRDIIEISSFYQNRPIIERLYMGMAILQISDIPISKLELDDQEKILRIQISQKVMDGIPNSEDYFDRIIREKVLFNVPIDIAFGR